MLSVRKKADGMSVQKLCPGVDYIITLRFPEPREFKISAAAGIWEALTGTWCVLCWGGAGGNQQHPLQHWQICLHRLLCDQQWMMYAML
jgi:hypothetical protein